VKEEEADHLGRGVRALRVGIGPGRAAAVPGVSAAMDDQGLGHHRAVTVAVHGATVSAPAVGDCLRRPVPAGDVAYRKPGGDELVGVDRSHGRVAVAVDDDQWQRQDDESLFNPTGIKELHPFHVSVVEINHNAAEKTLEISCKIFTDDFEKVLAQNYKAKVDLINPPNKAAMDTLVKKYISSHLSLIADGKPVKFSYIGFERESEAVYSYAQVDNIASVKKIIVTNKLMQDLFTDQINLVHVIVGGNRKSTKLDYPETQAVVEF